jgi:hypothetical protein
MQTPLNRPAPNLTFSELEMHYPDTLRAALWVILAVMIVWSVASTVLVGLAQRFTITGRNDVYSGQSAPLAKPMRSRAVSPARSAELYFFLLLLGAVVVTGIDARTAQALDAKAINDGSPGHAWCITRDGSGCTGGLRLRQLPSLWHGGDCGRRVLQGAL